MICQLKVNVSLLCAFVSFLSGRSRNEYADFQHATVRCGRWQDNRLNALHLAAAYAKAILATEYTAK